VSDGVTIRPATLDDMKAVFDWANDPGTRKASFTSTEIPWETHVAWYSASLESGDRVLLIAERDGERLGLLRFDRHRDREGWERCSIGINIAPEQRGKGLGTTLLVQGVDEARKVGIGTIIAEIRPDNVASVRAFEKAGYVFLEEGEQTGQPALKYLYELP